jgi:hypothetical protein
MPSSRQARWTRSAISPRFAISTLPNSWLVLRVATLVQPIAPARAAALIR